MRKGELYKHINGRDCAIMPLDIRYSTRGVYKVRVRWFNIVNKENIFDMNCIDKIEIKKEHIHNWKIINF